MKHLHYYQNHKEMNESIKNWLSTFLILAGLGLVPPSIAQGQNRKAQKEFVESLEAEKIDAALFVDYLNQGDPVRLADLESKFAEFKSANSQIKSNFTDIKPFVNRSGKQYLFNQKYLAKDYSGVDINNFTPDNWLTDMGNMIEDSKEPIINNWISDYESQTTVEIGVITINKLPEDVVIEEYALQQFRKLGVGKKGADNGILIVLSKEDRKWNITTGYGIEGILPDITCNRIGEQQMVPRFKEGDYFAGLMAALEKIKAEVGTENIEDKKAWLQKEKETEVREYKEAFQKGLQNLLYFLLVSGVVSVIAYAVNERQKAIQRAKQLEEERKAEEHRAKRRAEKIKENINQAFSEIERLKKEFPQEVELPESKSLLKFYDKMKQYFANITTEGYEYSKQTETNLQEIVAGMNELLDKYNTRQRYLKDIKSETLNLKTYEKQAYDLVEKANRVAQKIVNYGFKAPNVPQQKDVVELSSMGQNLLALVTSDIDIAEKYFKQYKEKYAEIKTKGSHVSTTLSDIESAMSRIQNWKDEVDRLADEYVKATGEEPLQPDGRLGRIYDYLESEISKSKNWLKLEQKLDEVLNKMRKAIDDYNEELERKRRRKEEQEEEERRRRRRREEDSYRSSSGSSWSSSDSSSGSSWGGFGGGSSGGGGASGSW